MREVARSRNLLSDFVTTLKRLFKSKWELNFVSYCRYIQVHNSVILESQTVWPIEVEKSDRFYILPLSPGLQTFFLLLQHFRCIQFKEQSRYVQGKHFNKLKKTEKSNHLANQDKKVATFLFYPGIHRDIKLYLQRFRYIQSEN